ncbi:MAG: type II toxin-antitoxin system VapC family toxin [Terracidiphilus sp.]
MILVDSSVLLDVFDKDPVWLDWSLTHLRHSAIRDELAINPIVYAEISPRFPTPAELDELLDEMEIRVLAIPRTAAFLAGKAFVYYRLQGGSRANVLPDFFIGAHALVLGCSLLTRDTRRYATYFPRLPLIAP